MRGQKEEKQRLWIIHNWIISFSKSQSHSPSRPAVDEFAAFPNRLWGPEGGERFLGSLPSRKEPGTTTAIGRLNKSLLNQLYRQTHGTTGCQPKIAVTKSTPIGVSKLGCDEGRDFLQWKQLNHDTAPARKPQCYSSMLQLSSSVTLIQFQRLPVLLLQQKQHSLPRKLEAHSVGQRDGWLI